MNLDDPIGIIELGNINLKCIIFRVDQHNRSEILCNEVSSAEGIANDSIVNLKKSTNAIRLAISNAERKANVSLKKINVIFEQPDFLCTRFSKHKKIDGSKIQRSDIEFLLKEAKKQLILNDDNHSIVHIFNHNYMVDKKIFIEEPINVFANFLSHEITFITTPKNNLKNMKQAFYDCDIEIEKFISRTFSLGVKLLDQEEIQSGSVLINLELEKTSVGLFKNLALVHSLTIPIGIDHIINDISKVCSLNINESKKIKENIDFSFENSSNMFDENNHLKKIFFTDSSYRKISKNLIFNIIKARLDEILEKLKKQIFIPGFIFNPGLKIILTGEGSNLTNIHKYFKNFFNKNFFSKKETSNEDKKNINFDACLGALRIIKEGWETEAIPQTEHKSIEKIGFFGKMFSNI